MFVDHVISFLNQGWVGITVGLLSAVFAARYAARKTEVIYTLSQNALFVESNRKENQVFIFDGISLFDPNILNLYIFVRGSRFIKFDEISKSNPLQLTASSDTKFIKIQKCTGFGASDLVCYIDNKLKVLSIEVGFLNPGAAIKISVLCDGGCRDVRLLGEIAGVGELRRIDFVRFFYKNDYRVDLLYNFVIIIFGILGAFINYMNTGKIDILITGVLVIAIPFGVFNAFRTYELRSLRGD